MKVRPPLVAAVAVAALAHLLALGLEVVPLWPAMLVASAVSWWAAWRPGLAARLRPTARLVAQGAGSALVLAALAAAGAVVARHTPLWASLRAAADLAGAGPVAFGVLVIVLGTSPAEEVLWRDAVLARAGHPGGLGALAVSTGLYALVVGASGNLALIGAALGCGAVWARQRQVTGSLVPSIVSHILWATLAYLLLPGLLDRI
jgi:CAAX protease family protein